MGTVLAPPESDELADTNGGNNVLGPGPPGGGGDPWGGGGAFPLRWDRYSAAVCVFLVPVVIFFVGLTRIMLASHESSAHWAVRLPPLLYVNTAVLLSSSCALEMARRAMRAASRRLTPWLWVATSLGFVFLAVQAYIWKHLAATTWGQGSNAGTAFFYLVTGSHGVHLLGALAALTYLSIQQTRMELTPRRQSGLRATAVFWHFMAGLWVYVLALLAWCS